MNRLAAARTNKAQWFFSLAVIIATAVILLLLYGNPPGQAPQASASLPVVDIMPARPQDLHLPLRVRGTVEPERQLTLVATVTGTVIQVSEHLAPGASFNKGDILLQADTTLLNLELHKARSALAQASLQEQQVMAELEAREPGQTEVHNGLSELALGKPQLTAARAAREAAQAAVIAAEKQLANATLRAPFNGRTMARSIQEQEQLIPGRPLAQIYSTDSFLVRLPLTQEQLAMIDIPATGNSQATDNKASTLVLRNENTGQQWQATLLRSEGFIGPNRLVNVLARVEQDTAALIPGSLLLAEIRGQLMEKVIVIPASALLEGKRIMLAGPDGRIRRKAVTVAWQDVEHAWINANLATGEHIVLDPPPGLADNTPVSTRPAGPAQQP